MSRVLVGRNRVESQRWTLFQAHMGIDAFYCQPGVDGAHEKGCVEGEGGRFRRNHCVPMPKVDSIAQLNELLAAADAKDDYRRIANRASTVGSDFAREAPLLRPLPTAEFPTWLTLEPRVDRYARVTVRQCYYSVPAKLIGRRVRGPARRLHRHRVRRRQAGRGARADHRPRRAGPEPGPLPRGPATQTRCAARRNRARAGSRVGDVHAGA